MKNKKRTIFLCIVALSTASILVGWKVKPIELLDNKPLIDLNTALQEPSWGQEGLTNNNTNNTVPEETPNITDNDIVSIDVSVAEKHEHLVVEIHGERIIIDDSEVKDVQTLKKILSTQYSENMTVSLKDNYAESHLYKEVRDMMEQLKQEINTFIFNEI